jgi:hypothetical protein
MEQDVNAYTPGVGHMSNEQYPMGPTKPETRSNCLKTAGITCLVLFVVAIALGLWLLNSVMKNPVFKKGFSEVKAMTQCMQNLKEIGGALTRYESRNGKYPTSLSELHPTFLEKSQNLHCPSDPSPEGKVSYEYFPPPPGAPGSTIVVQCSRHQIVKDQPPVVIKLHKDGTFDTGSYQPPGGSPKGVLPPPSR